MLSTLGTPTKESWPDLQDLPDYNKISFISSPGKSWSVILSTADGITLDLMKQIIIYDGTKRLKPQEVTIKKKVKKLSSNSCLLTGTSTQFLL